MGDAMKYFYAESLSGYWLIDRADPDSKAFNEFVTGLFLVPDECEDALLFNGKCKPAYLIPVEHLKAADDHKAFDVFVCPGLVITQDEIDKATRASKLDPKPIKSELHGNTINNELLRKQVVNAAVRAYKKHTTSLSRISNGKAVPNADAIAKHLEKESKFYFHSDKPPRKSRTMSLIISGNLSKLLGTE